MSESPRGCADAEGNFKIAKDARPWRFFALEAEQRLGRAGFASADIDARRIVERASGHEGSQYLLALEKPATTRGVQYFERMLERRLCGEPLQYVVGFWAFRTLELLVDRRALIPRPETESVVDCALVEIDRLRTAGHGPELTVIDLGTGSGAIALSMAAERDLLDIWATDRSSAALDLARANVAGLGNDATKVRLVEGSWFDALPDGLHGNADVIVSNPPYVAATDEIPPEVRDWEPSDALISGPTGLEALEHIVSNAPRWLARHGVLVVELAPHQAVAVRERALSIGYADVEVGRDLAGRERLVVARVNLTKAGRLNQAVARPVRGVDYRRVT